MQLNLIALLPLLFAPSALSNFLLYDLDIVTCTAIEGGDTICEDDNWYHGASTVADWTTDCSKQPDPTSIGETGVDSGDASVVVQYDPPICGQSSLTFETAGGDQMIAVDSTGAGFGTCSPANSTEVVDTAAQGFFVCVEFTTTKMYTVRWDCVSQTCS